MTIQQKIDEIYKATEGLNLKDVEKVFDDVISQIEDDTCEHCGERPSTGACFNCKMD